MARRATGHTGLSWITVIAGGLGLTAGEGNIIKSDVLLGRNSNGFAAAGSRSSGTATFWRNTAAGL
jgi:hypothetical protein